MIIVRLMGGLGNQMFQYAAGKALALRKGTALKLDLEFLLDRSPDAKHVIRDFDLCIFDIDSVRASREEVARFHYRKEILHRVQRHLFPVVYYSEPHFHFDNHFFDLPKNTYLDGYWQSPKYFQPYESVIRTEFQFKEPILSQSITLSHRINQCTAVCVNVRRTDYVTLAASNAHHGVCDMSYFEQAMQMLRQKLNHPHFFVFSDDPVWCVQNFTEPDTTVVSHEHKGTKFANYLQLMATCRHFIIPNSTFAWWGVWLSEHTNKTVVAPSRWFVSPQIDTSDLIPADWIRIDN